ncbi:LANO_0D03202g1_1 [Lachancea nothofagi CBS 11611]|uniref:Carnitine O-acetyltransferase, mitochondrial n=1 Tax=Lachancea nothofagi CBS 11611 TaxID=1266666 RepID=A0A1G4JEZ3_9SACH|nr:LANO_0D03202g1_1 [Lachancea nothofagi CBS 11611]
MREVIRIARRMVSTLQKFPFETRNGEHYFAQHPNAYYQRKRSGYQGVTFENQAKLPSLPVPELEETLRKYIQTIRPFCQTRNQLEEQKALCAKFAQDEGPELQQRLTRFAAESRNWLSRFWDDQAYLEYDDPVVPYVSYFYAHKPLPNSHAKIQSDPLIKATAIIVSVLRFLEAIKDEALPAEMIKNHPFCMNSFHLMFNNARIPGNGKDSNVFYSLHEHNYITVALKGNFYTVRTHNDDGKVLEPVNIWYQLYEITTRLSGRVQELTNAGIGTLTSQPRSEWYQSYSELMSNPMSRRSLDAIHQSSFMVCLDLDTSPVSWEEKSRFAWHGDGINRYYDKPLQFFVAKNGTSGFLAEHSKMDGTPTLLLNDYVCRQLRNLDVNTFMDQLKLEPFVEAIGAEHLPFLMTPAIRDQIKLAHSRFLRETAEHDLKVWHYNRFGKNAIKAFGFSPDSFIQQVIQLAVYKYLQKQVPTYEAASTRRFFKGRTETGRSVSVESAKFVADWEDPDVTDHEKITSLRASATAHTAYLKTASAGHGVDRHLFGLKNMLRTDEAVPDLFKDSLFKYSSTWLVSTSQLSSEYFEGYGWSQVNDNGFGLAYMLNKEWLHINIVNKPAASGLSVSKLHYFLTQAADEMFELLSKSEQPSSKL